MGTYCGCEYGLASLKGLLQQQKHALQFIITQTPKMLDNANINIPKSTAIHHYRNLQDKQPIISIVREANIDLLICTNGRTEIPCDIINLPKFGSLNVHDSLLPAYAGLDSERWSILNNERYSGVTVHRMSEQMDTGEIVIQRSISISPDETAWSLKYKHLDLYPDLLLNAINLIGIGNMNFTQYDSSAYHRFHALNHSDYQYDFSHDQFYLKRFIRATTDDKPKGYIIVKNTTFYPMSIELPEVNFRGIPGGVIGRIGGAIGVATNTDESGRSGVLVDKCCDVNGNIVAAASILETGNQL